MRWIASMVAEAHRILMRGGVFMYPRDTKDPSKPGACACCTRPIRWAWSWSRPGGRASTGEQAMMNVQPTSLHQRIGFVLVPKTRSSVSSATTPSRCRWSWPTRCLPNAACSGI